METQRSLVPIRLKSFYLIFNSVRNAKKILYTLINQIFYPGLPKSGKRKHQIRIKENTGEYSLTPYQKLKKIRT